MPGNRFPFSIRVGRQDVEDELKFEKILEEEKEVEENGNQENKMANPNNAD